MSTTNNGNNTAILVTTRIFPPRCCKKIEFTPTDSLTNLNFAIQARVLLAIHKEARQKIYKDTNVTNCKIFFDKLKNKEKHEFSIDFDGQIRRMEDSNIFFYYHYPDRQLPEINKDKLPSVPYIVGLIKEILEIIKRNEGNENSENKIEKAILVLHKGDLLGIDYNSFTDQIKNEISTQNITLKKEDVKIYTFSHDISDPIWRQFLSDSNFFNDIKKDDRESYLEKWLDPSEANRYFDQFEFTKA